MNASFTFSLNFYNKERIIMTTELLSCPRTVSEKLNYITTSINELEQNQRDAPKGIIRLQSSKGYPRYYYYKNKSDTKGQYLSADNMNLISSICQRDYNARMLTKLKELYTAAAKGLDVDLYNEIDSVYFSFPVGKQNLITPIIPVLDSYIDAWKKSYPGAQNSYEITNGIITNNGEVVRSKSEKIIADRLAHFDIPYVYEPRIILNYKIKYPDFIILNKNTRQTLIWEHLGLADDCEYAANNLVKLNMYESFGYYLGSSLIVTLETSDSPLDSQLVDAKIEAFLL